MFIMIAQGIVYTYSFHEVAILNIRTTAATISPIPVNIYPLKIKPLFRYTFCGMFLSLGA